MPRCPPLAGLGILLLPDPIRKKPCCAVGPSARLSNYAIDDHAFPVTIVVDNSPINFLGSHNIKPLLVFLCAKVCDIFEELNPGRFDNDQSTAHSYAGIIIFLRIAYEFIQGYLNGFALWRPSCRAQRHLFCGPPRRVWPIVI